MTAALELDSDSVPLLRPQHSSAAPTSDPAPETLRSELRVLPSPDPDNFTPSPTSPLCLGENCTTQKLTSNYSFHLGIYCYFGVVRHYSALQLIYMSFWSALVCIVEGLDNLGLTNSGPGFFTAIQRQMESQLMADPEMMRCILGSSFVQSALSSSSPQLTRQLILSNPQIQQLLPTNPEVGDVLNNADVISQVGDEKGCVSLCLRCKCVSSACQSSVYMYRRKPKSQVISHGT